MQEQLCGRSDIEDRRPTARPFGQRAALMALEPPTQMVLPDSALPDGVTVTDAASGRARGSLWARTGYSESPPRGEAGS
jgi:hypothetical protein